MRYLLRTSVSNGSMQRLAGRSILHCRNAAPRRRRRSGTRQEYCKSAALSTLGVRPQPDDTYKTDAWMHGGSPPRRCHGELERFRVAQVQDGSEGNDLALEDDHGVNQPDAADAGGANRIGGDGHAMHRRV